MVPQSTASIAPHLIREARAALRESPAEFARLLGVSVDEVHDYEAGRARPSPRAVRNLMLILAADHLGSRRCGASCWEIKGCAASERENCPSYRLNGGRMCWLLTDRFCSGQAPDRWPRDAACPGCTVFKVLSPGTTAGAGGRALWNMPRPARAPSGS